jgi:antitoxin (DNA-binding transcriptional repressor) of toxin-antitoxin stability system
MAVIHISEAEAVRDFASLLVRVRAGEEVVIDTGSQPVSLVLKSGWSKDPSVKATLERMKASSAALGYTPVMDAEFAQDMEEIIRNRKPADRSAWD